MAKKQKTKKKYELMAPAGDFPMLVAAVNAGADAVYFDLQEFTMRAAAKNFKVSDLERINKICGKKVKKYLTLNTIIYDNEIKRVEEIKKKIKEAGIELEAFAHGAMCVSISGRCFTSQFLFKKSANRGECLHPCRRTYTITDEENNELKLENSCVMSAKDLCTLPFIDKMKKAGITSFKIEGRNRDPRYVDAVVRIYRKAIDKKLTKQEIK